ncbi:SDR family NAD(P)-dependent oxidoreductase [Chitinophaga silvatica]|uniref:SDR family NAD(P)-dependent oxidoreductase n=1 Tax=Chitinophaga silvatica TaxID=2282649 RepID=A0A3E1YGW7_9BACT|nr:SDR family oxidoreductase [Chitinophaga silvatica]RFS26608.1 SDR family NAD(P)-dependent oxidoreductase [Chitinophaga silvatica]
MSLHISGKVIVITGASSGLGKSAARLLAEQGAIIVLAARRAEKIESLAEELTKQGYKVIAITTDVTNYLEVKNLLDTTVKSFGRVDVLINNAGLMPSSPLDRLKIDEWNAMIDVNIKGVLYGIAAALPYMKEQKSGHIINVASVAGHKVSAGGAVYAATKFAVRAISEGLRMEVKPYNIRTTIISPGAVDTDLPNTISEPDIAAAMKKLYEKAIPAESFARVVAFAISQPAEVDINEILFRPTSQEF